MTDRLSWLEVSCLKPGACVALGVELPVLIRGATTIIIPVGAVCTVIENGFEDWGGIIVRPVDTELQRQLVFHQDKDDGTIVLEDPGALDEMASAVSPFVLDDSCPPECI